MKDLEAGFEATRGSSVRIMVWRTAQMLEKYARGAKSVREKATGRSSMKRWILSKLRNQRVYLMVELGETCGGMTDRAASRF